MQFYRFVQRVRRDTLAAEVCPRAFCCTFLLHCRQSTLFRSPARDGNANSGRARNSGCSPYGTPQDGLQDSITGRRRNGMAFAEDARTAEAGPRNGVRRQAAARLRTSQTYSVSAAQRRHPGMPPVHGRTTRCVTCSVCAT